LAVQQFLRGQRILYAVPTQEQVQRFWHEVTLALAAPIGLGLFVKNETLHTIERPGTEQRLRAKTAWSPDTLRGDYASLLILDEYQLMSEDAWEVVGAPMLLDTNGDAVFCYTPPSFRTASVTKAHDPRHASKLFARAQQDTTGRWAAFHFTSQDNPYLSVQALGEITEDMTYVAYRQEILAEENDDAPGALWTRAGLEATRVMQAPALKRLVVGLDPGSNAGIVVAGLAENGHGYVLEDLSLESSPLGWAKQCVSAYHKWQANAIIAERNHGGEMVQTTLATVDAKAAVQTVWASQGKYARADPIAARYEQGNVHHVGTFGALEDELCSWVPGGNMPSPNRLDALVWALTALMLGPGPAPLVGVGGTTQQSHWRS
jgi:terminase large subunit-like protein